MKFGVFDHLDRNDLQLGAFYRARLALTEMYDAAGFHAYHVAEHHATPLGLSPSPSVYLSAVAQRTTRLRFGPMVYCLPLYHPLRLVEEICMLDQLSGGRLELGLGRGVSPFEAQIYGLDYAQSGEKYDEIMRILLQALDTDELNHAGKHWTFDRTPMHLKPVQTPHPPLWFGVLKRENAELAATRGGNMVTLLDAPDTRRMVDVYREGGGVGLAGKSLFVVVDKDGDEARARANKAYAAWRDNFHYLYYRNGKSPVFGERAQTFDELQAQGKAVAGTPQAVLDYLARDVAEAGVNYLVCQFAFGAMTESETRDSIGLFTDHVMPALSREYAAV